MRRIAIINQKGGVGKTTTTANLGAAVSRCGKRVLSIDLDPQAHLTLHYGVEVTDEQSSVYDVLTASEPIGGIIQSVRDCASLVPADIDLAGVEAELVSVMGREVILKEAVDEVAKDYDVLLIDCPPSLGVLTVNALVTCDEVIIPLQAQFFALQGLGKLLNTITLVRRRINPALRVAGVVLCMHEAATRLAGEVVEDLSTFLDSAHDGDSAWSQAKVFESTIRRNIKLAEACSFGQTIFEYAARSNGAFDYASLAAEVFPELGVTAPQRTNHRKPSEPATTIPKREAIGNTDTVSDARPTSVRSTTLKRDEVVRIAPAADVPNPPAKPPTPVNSPPTPISTPATIPAERMNPSEADAASDESPTPIASQSA